MAKSKTITSKQPKHSSTALIKKAKASPVEIIYHGISEILHAARAVSYRAVNQAMVQSYWHIGRIIVEEEQRGRKRAGYGEELISELARRLARDFGKGFNIRNLWYMRQFHLTFPILHAVRAELSWTHYRLLLEVKKDESRSFYMNASTVIGVPENLNDKSIRCFTSVLP